MVLRKAEKERDAKQRFKEKDSDRERDWYRKRLTEVETDRWRNWQRENKNPKEREREALYNR